MAFPTARAACRRLFSSRLEPRRFGVLLVYALAGFWPVYEWQSLDMGVGVPVFPVDDAYITLHNALIVAGRHQEHFIGADAFSGATSFAHTLLVAVFARWFPAETALSVTGLIGAMTYAFALVGIALRSGHGALAAGIIAFVGLASGYMSHHLTNGLETSWVLAAVAWCVYLAMEPGRHPAALAFVLAALPFLRPELGLLSVLVSVYAFHVLRPQAGRVFRAAALLAGFVLIWLGASWSFGWPLVPSTAPAKMFYFAEGCRDFSARTGSMITAIVSFLVPYGAILLGMAGLVRGRLAWVLALYALVFLAVYHANLPGALGHYEGRYMAALVPVFAYGFARLLAPEHLTDRRVAGALLVLAASHAYFVSVPMAMNQAVASRGFTIRELMPLSNWMQSNIDAKSSVMMHDVGFLGYTLPNPAIDLVGLKTARAAEVHRQITWPSCGIRRSEAISRLVGQEQPEYLVVLGRWDRVYNISGAAAQAARLQPVWERKYGYSVYRLTYRTGGL